MTVPQHSATAPIQFLKHAAFDTKRLVEERKAMPDNGDAHPLVIYFAGKSRYDLGAPYPAGEGLACARDYLKPDHGCPTWDIRRLGAVLTARLQDTGGRVAQLQALAHGFAGVDVDVPGFRPAADKMLTEGQIEQLAARFGLEDLYEVGEAVLLASAAPTAAEGKR